MDDELRKAFASLSGQMSTIASDVAATNSMGRQTLTEVRQLGGRVEKLERHVFGSDPPPASPVAPLGRIVTDHDSELATLAGQVIAVKGDIAAVRELNEAQTAKLDDHSSQLKSLDEKVDAIAAKPDTAKLVLVEMQKAAKTPIGQKLIGAAAALVFTVISLIGLELRAQVAKLEARAAAAQTATVPVPVLDGGVK